MFFSIFRSKSSKGLIVQMISNLGYVCLKKGYIQIAIHLKKERKMKVGFMNGKMHKIF